MQSIFRLLITKWFKKLICPSLGGWQLCLLHFSSCNYFGNFWANCRFRKTVFEQKNCWDSENLFKDYICQFKTLQVDTFKPNWLIDKLQCSHILNIAIVFQILNNLLFRLVYSLNVHNFTEYIILMNYTS